jgi:peptidoglycan/LPS O-acetylase OafA/YrhL
VLLLIAIGVRPHQLVWDALGISLVNVGIAVCLDRYMRLYSGPLGQFLNWRPIAWVGALSYSIYLWQQVFLLNARYRLPFPLDILGILLVSAASYYLVERPFLKLKDSYSIPARVRG